jgi:hypothetical protein
MDEPVGESTLDRYAALRRRIVGGRRIVLAGHHLAGTTKWVEKLLHDGASACYVLACAVGTGELPDDSIGRFVLGVTGLTPSDEVRAVNRALRDIPAAALEAIEAFDPSGDALVLCPPYMDQQHVAGRAVYGGRRPEWTALEDKTIADALFDRAGVERAPSIVAPVDAEALRAAAGVLDHGDGTVWAGDARDGFHGGGDLVRWVRPDDIDDFAAWYAPQCDRVRVAPFLEGIPCSIHGFVCDDGVAVFRPMEMVILRRPPDHPERSRFVYAGMTSLWDPSPADREDMRAAARRVGTLLAAEVDYRGAYTVDGIMTRDGFRPTEMNPRYGGALGYAYASLPRLGLPLLHIIAAAGDGTQIRSTELESLVVAAGDRTRWGASNMFLPAPCSQTSVFEVPGIGRITIGPGVAGTFARLEPDVEAIAPGPSFAARAIEAFERAESDLGLPVGPLVAATSVRSSTELATPFG